MNKTKLIQLSILTLALTASLSPAKAVENILSSYQNPRMAGMGGMKLTTGLYEENFTGNPARVTANPKWKVQLVDLAADVQPEGITNISNAASSGIEGLTDLAGDQNHLRVSPTLLGVYVPLENMSYAFGIQGSLQADIGISRGFRVDSQIIGDIGPSFTVGRKFLENKELSAGLSAHYKYRVAAPDIAFTDFLSNDLGNLMDSAGEGSKFDLDLGGTYILPWKPADLELTVATSVSNLLGSQYSSGLSLLGATSTPPESFRTFGLGITARQSETWKFTDTAFGIEIQDLGANGEGSFFRLLHLGAETHWKIIAMRLGVNQGYLCAGIGFDFKAAQLDIATFGEEMSLNAGGRENRSLAVRLGFQI